MKQAINLLVDHQEQWVNRRFRLRKASDLKRVRREGKSFAHPLIVLQVLPCNSEVPRIGIVASRSIGNAVKRNYAKRLLREAIRPYLPYIAKNWDLVLIARHPILEADFNTVQAAINRLLIKSKLLVKPNVQ